MRRNTSLESTKSLHTTYFLKQDRNEILYSTKITTYGLAERTNRIYFEFFDYTEIESFQ